MSDLSRATVLVTGAAGFVGRHLTTAVAATGATVVGIGRSPAGGEAYVQGDLLDAGFTARVVDDVHPTQVIHLAGALSGAPGGARVQYEANVLATRVLLAALVEQAPDAWTLVLSSSAVYGAPDRQPIGEDAPLRPLTDYAVSKVAQELVAGQYRLAHGLRVVVARAFNLVGPGQPSGLVVSDVARQVVAAERGGDGIVQVGNTAPRRDFLDVRDAVNALCRLAAAEADVEVCNVASGRSWSVGDCVDRLVAMATRPLRVESVADRRRPVEIPEQVGDASLLRSLTGWSPVIPLEKTLADVLDDWRRRVPSEGAA